MAQNTAATAEERRKNMEQQWADDAKAEIEKKTAQLTHYRALLEFVKDADRDDLRELFGEIMSDARSHHRDVVEARIWFSEDTDGEMRKLASVPMSSHAYADVSPDLSFRVPCDSFLGYEDIRLAARDALGQAIGGATANIEDAKKRAEAYDHGLDNTEDSQ